jgi:hypothetical protein
MMNILILHFLILFFISVESYKYITPFSSKTNFAKYSDKNIIIGLHKLIPLIKEQSQVEGEKDNINYYYRWWDPYWKCINNDLSPLNREILKTKFSYNFFEIRSNDEISKKFNISRNNVTEIIISSINYVSEKVRNEFEFGNNIFKNKVL